MKKACVTRLGAFGDMLMLAPVLPLLKRDGYHVTLNCHKRGAEVVKNNPHIDEFLIHDETIPNEALDKHWAELAKGYDKYINLSESIEKGLLAVEGSPEFDLSKEERHTRYNVNYYDRTLELAGYPEARGFNGELYFTQGEELMMADWRSKYLGKFKIIVSLSGSSFHKAYPYMAFALVAFLNKHPDAVAFTVGDVVCKLLEWEHPRTKQLSGEKGIRRVMHMTKYADLVIGPETGVLNAAACFDTPKIIFLSHSTKENLTKYWRNCTETIPEADCYPCHQLHYTLESCPPGPLGSPCCMSSTMPDKVFDEIEKVYMKWRSNESLDRSRREAVICR